MPLDPPVSEYLRVEIRDGDRLHIGNCDDDPERPIVQGEQLVGGTEVGMKIGHARLYGEAELQMLCRFDESSRRLNAPSDRLGGVDPSTPAVVAAFRRRLEQALRCPDRASSQY